MDTGEGIVEIYIGKINQRLARAVLENDKLASTVPPRARVYVLDTKHME